MSHDLDDPEVQAALRALGEDLFRSTFGYPPGVRYMTPEQERLRDEETAVALRKVVPPFPNRRARRAARSGHKR